MSDTFKQQLIDFNKNNIESAIESIYSCFSACGGSAVFVEYLLDKADNVMAFVSDKLNWVPFALLRDRERQKYLFELHPVSVAPSLRVLQHCDSQLRYLNGRPMIPEKYILAVDDASYKKREDLLPGSATELAELAQRFPGLVYRLRKCDATTVNWLELLKNVARRSTSLGFCT